MIFVYHLYVQEAYLISSCAMTMGYWSIYKLLRDFENCIPVFDFLIAFTYIQLIMASYWSYHLDIEWMDTDKLEMLISEQEYMAFAFPCLLITQLILKSTRLDFAKIQRDTFAKIEEDSNTYTSIGLLLFPIGILAQFVSALFPASFGFIFLLLSILPYIGFFYLWVSKFRYRGLILVIILVHLVVITLNRSIFITMISWSLYISSIIFYRKKINIVLKVSAFTFGVFFMLVIQVAKHQYRDLVWDGHSKGGSTVFLQQVGNALNNEYFVEIASASLLNRLNQGYVVSRVMEYNKRTSLKTEQFIEEVKAILIPRFLYPDKIGIGSREKLVKMANWRIRGNTTISIGIHGDSYGYFGYIGGLIFIVGFFYMNRLLMDYIHIVSLQIPSLLLWLPFIFFYFIRPGADFYSIANWIIKSIVILILFYITMHGIFKRWT